MPPDTRIRWHRRSSESGEPLLWSSVLTLMTTDQRRSLVLTGAGGSTGEWNTRHANIACGSVGRPGGAFSTPHQARRPFQEDGSGRRCEHVGEPDQREWHATFGI